VLFLFAAKGVSVKYSIRIDVILFIIKNHENRIILKFIIF